MHAFRIQLLLSYSDRIDETLCLVLALLLLLLETDQPTNGYNLTKFPNSSRSTLRLGWLYAAKTECLFILIVSPIAVEHFQRNLHQQNN